MSRPREPVRLSNPRSGARDELRQALRELHAERREFGERASAALSQRLHAELLTPALARPSVFPSSWMRWQRVRSTFVAAALILGATHHDSEVREASTSPQGQVETEGTSPAAPQVVPAVEVAPFATAEPHGLVRAVVSSVADAGGPETARGAAETHGSDARERSGSSTPAQGLRATRSRRPDAAAQTALAPLEDELQMLRKAQGMLETQPERALQLAERHRREHPHGVFAQEAEMLALSALIRLRRHDLARARAARFVARYPSSAHVRAVELMLRTMKEPPAGGSRGASTR